MKGENDLHDADKNERVCRHQNPRLPEKKLRDFINTLIGDIDVHNEMQQCYSYPSKVKYERIHAAELSP